MTSPVGRVATLPIGHPYSRLIDDAVAVPQPWVDGQIVMRYAEQDGRTLQPHVSGIGLRTANQIIALRAARDLLKVLQAHNAAPADDGRGHMFGDSPNLDLVHIANETHPLGILQSANAQRHVAYSVGATMTDVASLQRLGIVAMLQYVPRDGAARSPALWAVLATLPVHKLRDVLCGPDNDSSGNGKFNSEFKKVLDELENEWRKAHGDPVDGETDRTQEQLEAVQAATANVDALDGSEGTDTITAAHTSYREALVSTLEKTIDDDADDADVTAAKDGVCVAFNNIPAVLDTGTGAPAGRRRHRVGVSRKAVRSEAASVAGMLDTQTGVDPSRTYNAPSEEQSATSNDAVVEIERPVRKRPDLVLPCWVIVPHSKTSSVREIYALTHGLWWRVERDGTLPDIRDPVDVRVPVWNMGNVNRVRETGTLSMRTPLGVSWSWKFIEHILTAVSNAAETGNIAAARDAKEHELLELIKHQNDTTHAAMAHSPKNIFVHLTSSRTVKLPAFRAHTARVSSAGESVSDYEAALREALPP